MRKLNYYKAMAKNMLPPLPEDERIYFSTSYETREFAKACHCNFDPISKLWYTGIHNTSIELLLKCYNVHESTSEKARKLLEERIGKEK